MADASRFTVGFSESSRTNFSPSVRALPNRSRVRQLIIALVIDPIRVGLFLTNGSIWHISENLRSSHCRFLNYQWRMFGLKMFIAAIWGAPLILTATAGLGCLASRNLRNYLRKHIGM